MKHKLYLVLLAIAIGTSSFAQTLVKNMSSTNGDVYSVYKSDGSYYIGGNFTQVGLKTGYAALSTLTKDYPDMDFPAADGQIYAAIPDGSGGWYVGGYFTTIGGVSKQRLAHVMKNNTVDAAFTANCNS